MPEIDLTYNAANGNTALQGFINFFTQFLLFPADNLAFGLAVLFTAGTGLLVLWYTKNVYAALIAIYIPIILFTKMGLMPLLPLIIVSVAISMILAKKIIGGTD
jgi:hypothetical protein